MAKDKLVSMGCPSPVYKGGEEGPAGPHGAPPRGIPTPTRSRFPPFPSPNRRGKEG